MDGWLYNAFISPLTETYFQKALIGGIIVAVTCGVVGCLVILKRMAFLGDALSHAMIAGVAGGYLFMKLAFGIEAYAPAMLMGSLIAALLTVSLIGMVSKSNRVKSDTAIGIMYIGIFALGVVIVSIFRNYIHIDIMHFIMGDILGVADSDLWTAAFVGALVLTAMILFFRYFQITAFDPVMAASLGIPVLLLDYALTTSVSLVVVSAVSMVGVILVVGLLITPAATAYLLSDRLNKMMWLSALFGATSVIGGLYLCYWLDSAGGGAIMLFSTLQFVVVFIVAPKYGMMARWMKQHRAVPQQVVEDVLGLLARSDKPVQVAEITAKQFALPKIVRRAIDSLIADGQASLSGDALSLTEKGRVAAHRMLRAHRIWETYLESVGEKAEAVHETAHALEHLNDEESVDYLDHLLGHPEFDPHGKEVPRDLIHEVEGGRISLSMLREGRSARIIEVGPAAQHLPLSSGVIVTIGPRREGGETWTAILEDGQEIPVPHSAADAITVKPLEYELI